MMDMMEYFYCEASAQHVWPCNNAFNAKHKLGTAGLRVRQDSSACAESTSQVPIGSLEQV